MTNCHILRFKVKKEKIKIKSIHKIHPKKKQKES